MGGHALAEGGEHARVEGVGFGAPAHRAGEVAGLFGVDAGVRQAGLGEGLAQGGVVVAGGFEHHQDVAGGQAGDPGLQRLEGVGDLLRAEVGVEEIEMMLGDIDSDADRW